ncbi:O-acetyltransferase [Secundilactobacillus silagincola]|uniref:O-acetyltransferase n=1 Tax=Secundilactobacillus silagincola TaxID=1714681 RepID=A0A1Z5J1Z3_9LACO|nr:acyltransferase [Secundilactobacillus silagincola]GAX07741.1 O-acetyltransferase [Secundilactobacillus silagincola]
MNPTLDSKHQFLSLERNSDSNQETDQHPIKKKRKRIIWLDIAKGIAMIAVVFGHNMPDYVLHVKENRFWYDFLYWWHMPLFFLIAGFFLKPINLRDIQRVIAFLKKRVTPLLRSYFIAGLLLITGYKFIHNKSITYSLIYVLKLFYGGKTLTHYTTIFWYPETYILGIIGTTVIISLIRFKPLQLIIAAYFVYWSTSYTQLTSFKAFGVVTAPWDMDVAVLVMAYMLIGYNMFYFGKHYLTKWYVFLPSFVIVGWLFIQLKTLRLAFGLFMRSHQFSGYYQNVPFTHVQLALMVGLVPIFCSLTVFGISRIIAYSLGFTQLFAKIVLSPVRLIAKTLFVTGNHTLIIMYMHKIVLDVLDITQVVSSFWVQALIAVAVPLLIGMAYKKFQRTQVGEQLKSMIQSPVAKPQENDKL